MGKGVVRFRNMNIEKQPGELGRLKVLGGPDHGVVFILTAPRVAVGRGDENDVVLTDLKMSRRHLEITASAAGFAVRDLGSSNGFMVNGVPQKQAQLRSGDKIGLGETVMEFIGSEQGVTRMIAMPTRPTVKAVGAGGASGLTQYIQRPAPMTDSGSLIDLVLGKSKAAPGAGGRRPTFLEKNKGLMFILGGLMLVAALLPEVENKQRAKRNRYVEPKELEGRSLSSLRPPPVDPATKKSADVYVQEGFKELRAKNYLRAQVNFETALQIHADHPLASIYLSTTKVEMEKEAKNHISDAKKDEEAHRLPAALRKYSAVKRLYVKDQSNPLFKEADTRSAELRKKIEEDDQ